MHHTFWIILLYVLLENVSLAFPAVRHSQASIEKRAGKAPFRVGKSLSRSGRSLVSKGKAPMFVNPFASEAASMSGSVSSLSRQSSNIVEKSVDSTLKTVRQDSKGLGSRLSYGIRNYPLMSFLFYFSTLFGLNTAVVTSAIKNKEQRIMLQKIAKHRLPVELSPSANVSKLQSPTSRDQTMARSSNNTKSHVEIAPST